MCNFYSDVYSTSCSGLLINASSYVFFFNLTLLFCVDKSSETLADSSPGYTRIIRLSFEVYNGISRLIFLDVLYLPYV